MAASLTTAYTGNGEVGPPRPGRWILALTALVLLTEQTALGFQLVAPALIGFAAEYQTSQVIWVITIFTLVGGVATPLIGKLGDRFGKRRVLLSAAVVSMAGSIISALAGSFGVLLIGRALMGVSMAFLPVTFALIRDVFPKRYRAMSISITTNGVGVVAIAGPFLAGFLIDNFSLAAVFWFVGALSLVGSLGTIALVPETRVRDKSRIDYPGVIGLTGGLLLVMFGISQLSTWQLADYRTVLTIGGGLVILAAWWAWERRVPEPFMDTRLLSSRPVAPVLFSFAFSGGAFIVTGSYLPTMLQTPRVLGGDYGFGLTATGVALFIVPAGILTVVSGVLVGALAPRFGFRTFFIIGPALMTLGALGIGSLRSDAWMPIVCYAFVGLGAMIMAAGPGLLMVLTPARSRGVTAGMSSALGAGVGSLFAQLAGLVLSKNVGQLVQGQPIYTGHGMALVFLIAACMCVVGIAIAVVIPKRTEPDAGTPHTAEATPVAQAA